MTKLILPLFIMLLSFQFQARAAYIRAAQPQVLNYAARTHIFFNSRGNDLQGGPTLAALATKARIAQNKPQDQFVFYIAVKDQEEANKLIRFGLPNAEFIPDLFHVGVIQDLLMKFDKIASLHYFGHGGIIGGMYLDKIEEIDHDLRFNYSALRPELKSHFTKDSYVRLNACNQGQILAPKMSEIWGVPVAASLTGTHFEAIHQDGSFYWAEESSKKQYQDGWSNPQKSAFRMKPNYFAYTVHDETSKNLPKEFNRGLAFYKFYCYENQKENCQRRMANALIDTVTTPQLNERSTLEDFKLAAREWLCPTGRWGDKRQKSCMDVLSQMQENMDSSHKIRTYNPYIGLAAQCSMKSCFNLPLDNICMQSQDDMWRCNTRTLNPEEKNSSTALSDEYLNYIEGFRLLKKYPFREN